MAIFKMSQEINAPVERVFNTVIDIPNFPKWNPTNPSARKISEGETGNGSQFEMQIRGFGMVPQTLAEFERNKQVMIVPHIKMVGGGHRFIFTDLGNGRTRVDHEMIMIPKGIFKLMTPMMVMTGKKNVRALAGCLAKYLEKSSQ